MLVSSCTVYSRVLACWWLAAFVRKEIVEQAPTVDTALVCSLINLMETLMQDVRAASSAGSYRM